MISSRLKIELLALFKDNQVMLRNFDGKGGQLENEDFGESE